MFDCAMDGQFVQISEREAIASYHVMQTCDGRILRSFPEHDIVVIPRNASAPPVAISCERLVAGATYRIMGREHVAVAGYVTTHTNYGFRFTHMAQLTGTVPVGHSGAGVVNSNGEVVAIVSSATSTKVFVKELADTPIC